MAAFVPVAFGCGNLTAGGVAEVEVVVAADEGGSVLTRGVPGDAPAAAPSEEELAGLEGTLLVSFTLALVDGSDEMALTDGPVTVSMPLMEGARAAVAQIEVPAARYDGYRAVFTRVEAEITGSPGQASFPDFIEVDLSDGPLVFEHPAPLDLAIDSRIRVVLNLRSGAWLLAAGPSEGKVLRGVFRNAIRLSVETP